MSIEKTVLPGVWSLLDGGGYGSAKPRGGSRVFVEGGG